MPVSLASSSLASGSRLVSVASSQPARQVTADELGARFDRDGDWVQRRTGITRLRRFLDRADALHHARAAASSALADAGLEPGEVDLLLLASCSITAQAPIASELAPDIAPNAFALDLNSACSGFSYALNSADAAIRTGTARQALVVAVEWMSGLLDADDLGTSIIFGDGAGAAVIAASGADDIGIWPAAWGSDGSLAPVIQAIPTPDGPVLRMNGREVFRWAVDTVPGLVRGACERAGISTLDIDLLVLHQANLRIIESVARQLELRSDVVVAADVIESGNTSAASIPIALSRYAADSSLRGRVAVLAGFGAGLTFSAQVVRLPW